MSPMRAGNAIGATGGRNEIRTRVQAALFGHVPESKPVGRDDPPAVPTHGASVESDQTEDRAHGCCLVGAVGAEKAENAASVGVERGSIKGDDVSVTLVEGLECEHDDILARGPCMSRFLARGSPRRSRKL